MQYNIQTVGSQMLLYQALHNFDPDERSLQIFLSFESLQKNLQGDPENSEIGIRLYDSSYDLKYFIEDEAQKSCTL